MPFILPDKGLTDLGAPLDLFNITPPSVAPPAPQAPTITQIATAPVAVAPAGGQGLSLTATGQIPTSVPSTALRVLTADPASPVVGECWYRSDTSQFCVRHDSSTTKRVLLA